MINAFDNFFYTYIPHTDSIFMKLVSNLFSPKAHLVLWGALSIYVFSQKRIDVLNSKAFYLLQLVALIMFFCGILKMGVGRARPYMLEDGLYGYYRWTTAKAFLSFPSSHTAVAMGFCLLLQKGYNLSYKIYLLPLLIGLTRIILNQHFVTDIMAGMVIGYSVSALMLKYYTELIKLYLKVLRIGA